jgi:Rhs element Vgr protein
MSDPRIIPNQSIAGVVTFDVIIDGTAIRPEVEILTISIEKEVNRIPSAVIVIRDGNVSDETFEQSDGTTFMPGNTIEIKVGYDGSNKTMFKGIIVKHRIKISENGASNLTLECKDECVRLAMGRKNKYFENTTDSDAITEVLGGLAGEVESTSVNHDELVQHHTSDWDFIVMRAESNGKLVIPDDGVVNIKSPKTEAAALSIIYGSTILSFEAEMDARHQWKSVKTSAWNYTKQAIEEADVSNADFDDLQGNYSPNSLADVTAPTQFELRHSGQLSASEAETWAKATMLKSRMAKIRGYAKFTGFPDIKPGQWLELNGVGKRFEGAAFVSGIRHDISGGNWFTAAQFGMEPGWHANKPQVQDFPTGGLTAGVNGLQIGVVVQLESDPNGEDRIQVKLPTLDNNAKGIWSRVACLDAGNDRGSFFRPEIGDEVVVGFVNDDPREAIILGHLNSQAKPAHWQAKDDNPQKGFFTRSQLLLQFDDEKKIVTISTPAGNKIVLDEDDKSITLEDQNSNKIKMGTDGIEISSPKDIKITAQGKLEAKATMDLSAEGLNATVKANTNLTLNGQAGASLESSGVTKVQGSLLKLN